jgi:hypothetical protein
MGTSVYVKLRDGRCIVLNRNVPDQHAQGVKAAFDRWLQTRQTVNITTAHGTIEELTPSRVVAIEIGDRPDYDSGRWTPTPPTSP